MTSFKNIKGREGKFSRDCSRNLYKYIKSNPEEYPSTLKELMTICNLECDFESVKVYQHFHSFLQKHRKYTEKLFSILIDEKWFDKYKDEGLSDEDIYHRFIDTCLSFEIVPLFSDVDAKYYLIDLHSFLLMKKERLICASSEIKHKVESFKNMEQLLPDTIHSELEMLRDSPDIAKLLKARDGLDGFLLGENIEE